MSYILAATDFSTIANNAVQYAAGLAAQHNMSLVLLHSFIFPAMVNDVTIPVSLVDETRADAEKNIRIICDRMLAAYPGITVGHTVAYGNFTDAVNQYAHNTGAPWLLVMGNSNTQETSSWFFSTLKNVNKEISCPVLAVPLAAFYTRVQRICYADDIEQRENTHMLNELKDITLRSGATLHVLNVQQDASLHDDTYQVGETTLALLADTNPQYHYRHLADIDDAILEFCNAENIDWLVLTRGKYSFFEGLFHKSHTKALAEMMRIPILLLH